jgi:hypothetical protein
MIFDGGMEMDEGYWPTRLTAHEREVSGDEARQAILERFSDITTTGGTVIVPSRGEHWGYSLIGWCIMGMIVCCIALILVAVQ